MKQGWKYLLYASIVIVGGFILFQTIRLKNTGFEGKTLWDWMELLIIPLFLAGGAFFLNRSERNTEREIATDRQQEVALQAYLDRMADLLLKEKLRTTKNKEVRDVARIRTLTVLRGLDSPRKVTVLRFIIEARLVEKEKTVLDLTGANLCGVDLRMVDLSRLNLNGVDLNEADLSFSGLVDTNLFGANLRGAKIVSANLNYAKLSFADLRGSDLRGSVFNNADMSYALLSSDNKGDIANIEMHKGSVDLHNVDLRGISLIVAGRVINDPRDTIKGDINLTGAVFYDANLKHAFVNREQLAKAKSLKGATMPDGTIHE